MFAAEDFNFLKMAACIIFPTIGLAAFIYGKKNAFWKPMVIGAALMAYPYFVSQVSVIYLVGIILTAGLYFWRE